MKAKKKILHTMTWLAPGGGVDNEVYLAIKHLIKDFDIELAVGNDIQHNNFESIAGLKIHIIKNMGRKIHLVKDVLALWELYHLIKKNKYNIVHTHETKASLLGRIAGWLAGTKNIIYGLHGVTFNDPHSKLKRNFYIWLERLTVGCANLIVAVGKDTINQYHQNNIAENIPYKIVYSGIDTEKFTKSLYTKQQFITKRKELGIAVDDIVLINVGRFSIAKAQKYTIEAFAQLKQQHQNIKLLLVGEGEEKQKCLQQVKELNIADDVIFYGFTNNVPSVLQLADIFVLTSLREGLPTVVVEAGLCSLPTVSFKVEGISEIVEEAKSGYIVSQYDIMDLGNKLNVLISDEAKRIAFGKEALTIAKKNWDYRKMNEGLREIYNNLS